MVIVQLGDGHGFKRCVSCVQAFWPYTLWANGQQVNSGIAVSLAVGVISLVKRLSVLESGTADSLLLLMSSPCLNVLPHGLVWACDKVEEL